MNRVTVHRLTGDSIETEVEWVLLCDVTRDELEVLSVTGSNGRVLDFEDWVAEFERGPAEFYVVWEYALDELREHEIYRQEMAAESQL